MTMAAFPFRLGAAALLAALVLPAGAQTAQPDQAQPSVAGSTPVPGLAAPSSAPPAVPSRPSAPSQDAASGGAAPDARATAPQRESALDGISGGRAVMLGMPAGGATPVVRPAAPPGTWFRVNREGALMECRPGESQAVRNCIPPRPQR